MKIDENSVKINEIDDDDDDDDCGGDGGSSSILYLKTPDQPPLAATMSNKNLTASRYVRGHSN